MPHILSKRALNLLTNFCTFLVYLLLSILVMLMPLPVFRHCRHHVLDVNNFKRLPLFGVISTPRSISDERHDDESSKLEPRRRWR